MKITQTNQFQKDIKRQQKRGKNLQKLKAVIELLAE
jgi:mRNA-degrading endonuclease YafQ of YafQ-DinJ toxin-antitoxin module